MRKALLLLLGAFAITSGESVSLRSAFTSDRKDLDTTRKALEPSMSSEHLLASSGHGLFKFATAADIAANSFIDSIKGYFSNNREALENISIVIEFVVDAAHKRISGEKINIPAHESAVIHLLKALDKCPQYYLDEVFKACRTEVINRLEDPHSPSRDPYAKFSPLTPHQTTGIEIIAILFTDASKEAKRLTPHYTPVQSLGGGSGGGGGS